MPASEAVAIGRVERCIADHDEERPLRIALVEVLRDLVPFGAHVWVLTDLDTGVGTAPLATVPDAALPGLPRLIRTRYLTTVNRWDRIEGRADSLLRATDGTPSESLLFREVLSDLGVRDVATVVFRDQGACWGWAELWRFHDDEPFSSEELGLLGAVASPITAALRRGQARTFDDPTPMPERSGPVVLLLSPELEVQAQTPETDAYLRALLPPGVDRRPIPAGAYNVAAQLLAVEAGVDDRPAVARVHLSGGVWLTFRAARVEGEGPATERGIAVTIEPTAPSERRMLFARTHGLSARETELLELLADGADTKAIAEAMFLSEHTVQDHLKSIFAKTGARNRRTLLSRVSGR